MAKMMLSIIVRCELTQERTLQITWMIVPATHRMIWTPGLAACLPTSQIYRLTSNMQIVNFSSMTERQTVSSIITSGENVLKIIPASEEIFARLQVWPKGVLKVNHEGKDKYLFVLQDQKDEVVGLRFHFGWHKDRDNAMKMLTICRLLLPTTLALCAKYPFKGVLLPCPYISVPEQDSHVGYILFLHSLAKFDGAAGLKPVPNWEETFGEGACAMIETFLKLNYEVWKSAGLPDRTIADLSLAYRSQSGALATDYLMVDSQVVCIKQELEEDNPILQRAAEAGLKEMYWLPLLPTTLVP